MLPFCLSTVDGDGNLDLVVGERDSLNYFKNTGTAQSPVYSAMTGSSNPFDGIDVGYYSAPAFADGTGTKRCVGICNEHTMFLCDLVCLSISLLFSLFPL